MKHPFLPHNLEKKSVKDSGLTVGSWQIVKLKLRRKLFFEVGEQQQKNKERKEQRDKNLEKVKENENKKLKEQKNSDKCRNNVT